MKASGFLGSASSHFNKGRRLGANFKSNPERVRSTQGLKVK